MSLEDFSPEIESSEGVGGSNEAIKEISEKYKESSKKAGAKIRKTQSDEKKAKKYDFLLAGFLVKIIINKKYDFILDSLFPIITLGFSSNFVLGILSLVYIEISEKIRLVSKKEQIVFNYVVKNYKEEFDDNNINTEIKNRINYWIEDIIDSVCIEYSSIQTEKLQNSLEEEIELLLTYISKIFTFFLQEINISISETKAINISKFIVSEVKKSISELKIEKL